MCWNKPCISTLKYLLVHSGFCYYRYDYPMNFRGADGDGPKVTGTNQAPQYRVAVTCYNIARVGDVGGSGSWRCVVCRCAGMAVR